MHRTKLRVRAVAWIAANGLLTGTAFCAQQYAGTLMQIQSPGYNEDCLWFMLWGVSQADPVNPNSPWFGIPRTRTGYGELYALFLVTKLSGPTAWVATTGAAAGGASGGVGGFAAVLLQ